MKHRRVWIEYAPDDAVSHPEQCQERGTWCTICGCCEHCHHECGCTSCGCSEDWHTGEPVLHVVEDETP